MTEASVRHFEITPSQYQLFRFSVFRPTTLHIQMIATAPVNVLLLDDEEKNDYEYGRAATHRYTAAWGRRSELEATEKVKGGTWYLIVEGSEERSSGRIEVFQE